MSQGKSQFDFNDRYGVKPVRGWIKYAVVFGVLGGGWLLWAGIHHSNPEIRTELISFITQDPRNPEIRYSVQRASGSDVVICTLTARDFEKNVVGQLEDTIPAGDTYLERTITIPTRADAVNAGIERCRVQP
jgi:predicted alpha/beta hydrolase family esterase